MTLKELVVNTSNTLKLHRVQISMTLSSISRVFISNPSATRTQKYALLSPKLCKYSHSLPKDPTSWFSYWLPLHRLMHHPVYLELQAQDVVLLKLQKFYTYVEALTAGGRPVSLRLSSLALNFWNRKKKFFCWLPRALTIYNASGTESSIARPTIKRATVD